MGFYRERFGDVGMYEIRVYQGIEAVLDHLCVDGYSLFVATSKPKFFADEILDHFQLSKYFIQVYGSNLDGSRSSKAEVIEDLLVGEQIQSTTALMVGDREHDVRGAAAHGIPCIGVLYGYGLEPELREAGATALCAEPLQLADVITMVSEPNWSCGFKS